MEYVLHYNNLTVLVASLLWHGVLLIGMGFIILCELWAVLWVVGKVIDVVWLIYKSLKWF